MKGGRRPLIGYILWSLLGAFILFCIVGLWFAIHYWLNPTLENPDGKARITGRCGDTIEIALRFRKDRCVKATHWTDGCAYSFNCALAAADLARGKTPDEIIEIDSETIQKSIGGLPRDQMHCADLAAETLHAALDNYMRNQISRRNENYRQRLPRTSN